MNEFFVLGPLNGTIHPVKKSDNYHESAEGHLYRRFTLGFVKGAVPREIMIPAGLSEDEVWDKLIRFAVKGVRDGRKVAV